MESNVKNKSYVPDAGDIIFLNLDPVVGHEQGGTRPVVVLSPAVYNGKTGLALCVPLTTKQKGYPFEVTISTLSRPSWALADAINHLDWLERKANFKGRATSAELEEIRTHVRALTGC